VNFKQIQPQRPGRFSNALPRRATIGRWVQKQTLNITLSTVKLLMTLWMVYQYTKSLQKDTGILLNSVAGDEGNRSGALPPGQW
jgi:hypothetical protein